MEKRTNTFARNADARIMRATSSRPQAATSLKFFDVQNKKFVTISCCQCGYTELYRRRRVPMAGIFWTSDR